MKEYENSNWMVNLFKEFEYQYVKPREIIFK